MTRWATLAIALLFSAIATVQYTGTASGQDGWITLFDGKNLDHFNMVGNANWKIVDGVVQADKGEGFLVTKDSYGDFEIKAEFWVDDDANSGIFIRCTDPQKPSSKTGYEVNIYDKRPDPTYGTGAIVGVAKVSPMPKAGGKWNTYEITAKGPQMTVVLNGTKTVEAQDGQHPRGVIGLQYGAGVVKFRKVEIKPL